MKLRKLALMVSLAAVAGAGLNGCRLLDDDSDRSTQANTITALNNYLVSATCCLDENNNKACDGNESTETSDINASCTVFGATGNLLVVTTTGTTVSQSKGVAGSPVGAPRTFSGPLGSTVVSPLTTMIQIYQELYNVAPAVAKADILGRLGLGNIDVFNYDYIDQKNGKAEVASELLSQALAENVGALTNANATASPTDVLRAAVSIIVDPNNGAGIKGTGNITILQAIGQQVASISATQPATVTVTMDQVRVAAGIPNVATVPADQLNKVVTDAAAPDANRPRPTGATGGTGGAGGAGD